METEASRRPEFAVIVAPTLEADRHHSESGQQFLDDSLVHCFRQLLVNALRNVCLRRQV